MKRPAQTNKIGLSGFQNSLGDFGGVDSTDYRNRDIDALLDLIEAGRKPIEEGGDMDYASQTIRSLAGSPRFLMKGFACLPGLALSFL